MVTGGGCLGLFGRPGRGACYQPVVGWRGSWRGACQKFSQVVGVRDACSHVVRMAGSSQVDRRSRRSRWLRSAAQKRSRIVLMIDV